MARLKPRAHKTAANQTPCRSQKGATKNAFYATFQPLKPHRYRPGCIPQLLIRKYQKSTALRIRKLPFQRLIREIVQDSKADLRIQPSAEVVLRKVTEVYLTNIFKTRDLHSDKTTRVVHKPKVVQTLEPDFFEYKDEDIFSESSSEMAECLLQLEETEWMISELPEHVAKSSEPEETERVIEFTDKSSLRLTSSFVDVFLFGEWTEGVFIDAEEERATVIVSSPFIEEQLIVVPIEHIADFRSETIRSSLTSGLHSSIGNYSKIEFRRELEDYLSSVNTEVTLVQVFAGLLPIGCAHWRSVDPGPWDNSLVHLICCSLQSLLDLIISSNISFQTVSRIWPSLSAAETIAFPHLQTNSEFEQVLVAHFQVMLKPMCPVFITKTFKDLMPYCGSPVLPWVISPERVKIELRGESLFEYGKAALIYIDYCTRTVNWLPAFSVLLNVLSANVLIQDCLHTPEKLNSLLLELAFVMDATPCQAKADMMKLLFTYPYPAGDVTADMLQAWCLIDAGSTLEFLNTAPGSVCVKFLNCCYNRHSPYRYLMEQVSDAVLQELVLYRTTPQDIVPLCFALRGHRVIWQMRQSQVIAKFLKVRRQVCLWVWEKTPGLQRIPRSLHREVVRYI